MSFQHFAFGNVVQTTRKKVGNGYEYHKPGLGDFVTRIEHFDAETASNTLDEPKRFQTAEALIQYLENCRDGHAYHAALSDDLVATVTIKPPSLAMPSSRNRCMPNRFENQVAVPIQPPLQVKP